MQRYRRESVNDPAIVSAFSISFSLSLSLLISLSFSCSLRHPHSFGTATRQKTEGALLFAIQINSALYFGTWIMNGFAGKQAIPFSSPLWLLLCCCCWSYSISCRTFISPGVLLLPPVFIQLWYAWFGDSASARGAFDFATWNTESDTFFADSVIFFPAINFCV